MDGWWVLRINCKIHNKYSEYGNWISYRPAAQLSSNRIRSCWSLRQACWCIVQILEYVLPSLAQTGRFIDSSHSSSPHRQLGIRRSSNRQTESTGQLTVSHGSGCDMKFFYDSKRKTDENSTSSPFHNYFYNLYSMLHFLFPWINEIGVQ